MTSRPPAGATWKRTLCSRIWGTKRRMKDGRRSMNSSDDFVDEIRHDPHRRHHDLKQDSDKIVNREVGAVGNPMNAYPESPLVGSLSAK